MQIILLCLAIGCFAYTLILAIRADRERQQQMERSLKMAEDQSARHAELIWIVKRLSKVERDLLSIDVPRDQREEFTKICFDTWNLIADLKNYPDLPSDGPAVPDVDDVVTSLERWNLYKKVTRQRVLQLEERVAKLLSKVYADDNYPA